MRPFLSFVNVLPLKCVLQHFCNYATILGAYQLFIFLHPPFVLSSSLRSLSDFTINYYNTSFAHMPSSLLSHSICYSKLAKPQPCLSQIFCWCSTEKLVEEKHTIYKWPYFFMTTNLRWSLRAFPKEAHSGSNSQIQYLVLQSFTGMQTHSFVFIFPMAAFTLRQSLEIVEESRWTRT